MFLGDLIGNEGPIITDAKTLVGLAGPGSDDEMNYDGEMILLATTSIAQSTCSWTVPRDGFILGWRSNLTSGFAIAVNIDPPVVTALPGDGSVTTNLVAYVGATVNNQMMQAAFRFPLKALDVVKIKTGSASKLVIELYVGYPIAPTVTQK